MFCIVLFVKHLTIDNTFGNFHNKSSRPKHLPPTTFTPMMQKI